GAGRRAAFGAQAGCEAGAGRDCGRDCRGTCADAGDAERAVWSELGGSRVVWRGGGAFAGDCAGSVLFAGAKGDAGGSDGGAKIRVSKSVTRGEWLVKGNRSMLVASETRVDRRELKVRDKDGRKAE